MSSTSTAAPLPPDVSRGSDLVIVCWVTVSIALLLVSLRFYIRGILRKNLGWDDHLTLLAAATAIVQSVLGSLQVQNGFGRNIQYVSPVQLKRFGLYTNVNILIHTAGTLFVRVSVCLFVLRLVPTTETSYRRWIWVLLVFNFIVSLAAFLGFCFQCIPLSGLWDHSIKAQCFPRIDMTKTAQFQGSTAAVTDLLCVLLPMWVFRTLQASTRDKVAVFLILGLGLFTAATAVARTMLLDLESPNLTWDNLPVGIWASLEQNVGIAVASMPALRQLLTIRKKQHSSRSSEPLYNDNRNIRSPLGPFAKLPYNDCMRLPDDDSSPSTSSGTPTPKRNDFESPQPKRGSLAKPSTTSALPLWTDRKISLAETVEMSRVSPPTPTILGQRKPSAAETLRLSMVPPSWHGRKTSSTTTNRNSKRLSLVSPLSIDRPLQPAPLFSAQRKPHPSLGRFEETGLRNSRVATSEEIRTLAHPAAMGYSCTIEGPAPSPPSPPLFRTSSPPLFRTSSRSTKYSAL